MKYVLHVGCGSPSNKLPRDYAAFKEVRLDCNPGVAPNIIGSIVAMPQVRADSYDAVFAAHVLEHLTAPEAALALAELHRVLVPGGFVDVRVPDLQAVGGRLAVDQPDATLYVSPIGPVAALDILYGHRGSVGAGNLFMAHKYGYTAGTLARALAAAGFHRVEATRGPVEFELRATAFKPVEPGLPRAHPPAELTPSAGG